MEEIKDKHYFLNKGMNAEKFVHDLAHKTFLIDWCFLNPKLPNKKELCDLLIVFDDVVVIWQIKDPKLDGDGKYNRKDVDKNLRQIIGARRQLLELKTSIVLENPRRKKEQFDAEKIKKIFLISALLGDGEDYYSAIENSKNFTIHVFSREFISVILSELDTISDFIRYLEKREEFLSNTTVIINGGEKELLASYLKNNNSFETYKGSTMVVLKEGLWDDLKKNLAYLAKKTENEYSYCWDNLIETMHTCNSDEYEVVAREAARCNRFQRRILSKFFIDAAIQADQNKIHPIFRRLINLDGVTYCLLFQDDREQRKTMLYQICLVARISFPDNVKVIGIATEKTAAPTCSYDFCLFNPSSITEEMQKNAQLLREKLNIFKDTNNGITIQEDEYPNV